jgi:hypothetical protein
MRFYYENYMGDSGYFSEDNLVRAIYAAWNIDANLYLLNKGLRKIEWNDRNNPFTKQCKIVFAPLDGNEFNSDVLEEFGYKMEDGEEYREIIEIATGKPIRYDWSEVKQLV